MARSIPEFEVRRVAVEASCDPRSVRRLVDGKPIRPLTRSRIVAALKKAGLTSYLPAEPASARKR